MSSAVGIPVAYAEFTAPFVSPAESASAVRRDAANLQLLHAREAEARKRQAQADTYDQTVTTTITSARTVTVTTCNLSTSFKTITTSTKARAATNTIAPVPSGTISTGRRASTIAGSIPPGTTYIESLPITTRSSTTTSMQNATTSYTPISRTSSSITTPPVVTKSTGADSAAGIVGVRKMFVLGVSVLMVLAQSLV